MLLFNLAFGSSDLADWVNGDTPLTPPAEEHLQILATTTEKINLERMGNSQVLEIGRGKPQPETIS